MGLSTQSEGFRFYHWGPFPKLRRVRSNSALYQADILVWCEEHDPGYTITTDQAPAVKEVVKTARDWTALRDQGWETRFASSWEERSGKTGSKSL